MGSQRFVYVFGCDTLYLILVDPLLLRVSLGSLQQRIICTFADVLSAANLQRVRFKLLLTMLPFTLPIKGGVAAGV